MGLFFFGTWNVSGPGMEPLSLALSGRLTTTGPPEKSHSDDLLDLPIVR